MQNIKKLYLYAVSLISLVILVFGFITLINMGLKTWVFTKADKDYYYAPPCPVEATPTTTDKSVPAVKCNDDEQKKQAEDNRIAQKQRDAAQALAMILVASPVFYYHWRLARKEA